MITDDKEKANKIDSKGRLIKSLTAQSQTEGIYLMAKLVSLNIAVDSK
jgi:hypothetical protein